MLIPDLDFKNFARHRIYDGNRNDYFSCVCLHLHKLKKMFVQHSDFSVFDSSLMAKAFSRLWTHLFGIFHSFAHFVECNYNHSCVVLDFFA
jgi:hypothetical protein